MKKISKRKLLSSMGKAGLLATGTSGLASAKNDSEKWFQRTSLSNSLVNKTLGQLNSSAVFHETQEFLKKRGHQIKRVDSVGYSVLRADGKQYKEIRVPIKTSAANTGTLRLLSDSRSLETQINLPAANNGKSKSFFCDNTTLNSASSPVPFKEWVTIYDTGQGADSSSSKKLSTDLLADKSSMTEVSSSEGVTTTATSPPDLCTPLGGSDLCAAIDLLGIAAGALVALAEPGPFGELTLVERIGTAGTIFGGVAGTCSALEIIDGYLNCESDKYYLCPQFVGFNGYIKVIPACTL